MLAVKLICIGKLKDKYLRDAMAEYEKRLKTLCKFEVIELSEARMSSSPSEAEINAALDAESEQILGKAAGTVIPLCVEGELISSEGLAERVKRSMEYPGSVSFIIGSSHGLGAKVKAAGTGISMGRMTFPHALARVMLTEQIYRAFQILRGTPYHK